MKKIDVVFLVSVLGFASFLSVKSVTQAVSLLPTRSASESEAFGAAGKARDVDVERLLQLLREQRLSHREAEFYKPSPSASSPDVEIPDSSSSNPE